MADSIACPRCKELEAKLDYYQTRGQKILDLTAQRCLESLESDQPITPAMLNTVRQFLKDQGVIDLSTGDTPLHALTDNVLPFATTDGGKADFDMKEDSA